jgi:hypothetical protein
MLGACNKVIIVVLEPKKAPGDAVVSIEIRSQARRRYPHLHVMGVIDHKPC